MVLFKEFKKRSISDPRQTFEAIVNDKLEHFNNDIMRNNSVSHIANELRVDFLLEVAPFIQEYYEDETCVSENNNLSQSISTPSNIQHYIVEQQSSQRKGAVYDKYMKHIGESNVVERCNGHCPKCNRSRIFDSTQSTYICEECGIFEHVIESSSSVQTTPSANGDQNEITPYYAYKRSNHFSEWLSQLQGKETTHIPADVYDGIQSELKKERIVNMNDISHVKVRGNLKNFV